MRIHITNVSIPFHQNQIILSDLKKRLKYRLQSCILNASHDCGEFYLEKRKKLRVDHVENKLQRIVTP